MGEAARELLKVPRSHLLEVRAYGAKAVAEAVEIARALGRLPPRLLIYGIEEIRFELGGSLSLEVAAAVELLTQEIARASPKVRFVRDGRELERQSVTLVSR